MNRWQSPLDDDGDRPFGPIEQVALAAVRLAAVPLLLVAILMTGAIYGLMVLVHAVALAGRWVRIGLGVGQRWGKAAASSR